ncbi:hypothetical protein [Flavobacterium sp. CAN_S2]|uniref:hypothetical protein n=1 Tax=Flavobacterium sp. CAN_S2 TaxID=2787726 RepID=UPI0018CA2DA3
MKKLGIVIIDGINFNFLLKLKNRVIHVAISNVGYETKNIPAVIALIDTQKSIITVADFG